MRSSCSRSNNRHVCVCSTGHSARVLCLLMPPTSMPFVSLFCFCFWGRAKHFFTSGWHAAWVNRKKVGNKDHREDEMFLTNVTTYQSSMHDTCHVVLYVRTVPNAHEAAHPPQLCGLQITTNKRRPRNPAKVQDCHAKPDGSLEYTKVSLRALRVAPVSDCAA